MTVQVRSKETGKIITEQYVTGITIAYNRYRFTYDRRIRTTMVEKSIPIDAYTIENIIR